MMYTLLITRYDVCAALCSDQAPSDEANLYYSFIDEIYPNLYPSMNSAINLLLYTGSGSREVLIEAEITGFSQQYYQMVTVTPEIRFFPDQAARAAGGTVAQRREDHADRAEGHR